MFKVKNKTKEPRKFREYKNANFHFLRPGEEVIISNQPITKRLDIFEITDLSKPEISKFEEDEELSTEREEKPKRIKQRKEVKK